MSFIPLKPPPFAAAPGAPLPGRPTAIPDANASDLPVLRDPLSGGRGGDRSRRRAASALRQLRLSVAFCAVARGESADPSGGGGRTSGGWIGGPRHSVQGGPPPRPLPHPPPGKPGRPPPPPAGTSPAPHLPRPR